MRDANAVFLEVMKLLEIGSMRVGPRDPASRAFGALIRDALPPLKRE
jgi:hypothetical protein